MMGLTQAVVILQDDLMFLPHKVSSSVGHLGPLVLCTRVMNTLHLMEPASMRTTQVEVGTHMHFYMIHHAAAYTPHVR